MTQNPKPVIKDIPNLLAQHPMNPALIQNLPQLNANPKPDLSHPSLAISPDMIQNLNQDQKDAVKNDPTLLLQNHPVRRYKQYTEDTLRQALKEIMAGQSINRSSMKYNIPARTIRDWMKRLNIKSVFTHHSQKDGRSSSADSSESLSEFNQNSETTMDAIKELLHEKVNFSSGFSPRALTCYCSCSSSTLIS